MKYSFTIGGLAGLLITHVLSEAGMTTGSEEVDTFIKVLSEIGAAAVIWYGRWRQGDITWYGVKK